MVEDVDNIENEYTDAQELAAELEHDNEQVPPLLQLRVTPELVPHPLIHSLNHMYFDGPYLRMHSRWILHTDKFDRVPIWSRMTAQAKEATPSLESNTSFLF